MLEKVFNLVIQLGNVSAYLEKKENKPGKTLQGSKETRIYLSK